MLNQIIISVLVLASLFSYGNQLKTKKEVFPTPVIVPAGGNSWVVDGPGVGRKMISKSGICNWSEAGNKVRIYFKLPKAGELHLALDAKTESGISKLKCTVNGQSKQIVISDTTFCPTFVGSFSISQPGYNFVELEGIKKDGAIFANVGNVQLGGAATDGKMYFVKDDFYWGRRGPSVHLKYVVPEDADKIEWFYNEITVPEGEDVMGSYFMANGFGEGYFGMQVNSDTERRILFSVWSPFKTQDPKKIPEEYKIVLLKKGEEVHAGEFGNEGSGGQSFLRYMWRAGKTYRFLLRGKPTGNNSTIYTAYFFAPKLNEWKLIASFKRPFTDTYLTNQHSFLENFITETGNISRKAFYANQWVCDISGKWHAISKVKFTADATARKESRMDYAGGVENGQFFMKNCGFFNETTPVDSYHEKVAPLNAAEIDFSDLP